MQIRKSCIEQEQEIAVLKNDVASSNNKQSQLIKSTEQLKDKLLVSTNQFLESSNRNMTLEITIVDLKQENQLMLEELCKVRFMFFFLCMICMSFDFECKCHIHSL